MPFFRYQSPQGEIGFARQHEDGSATRINGDPFSDHEDTTKPLGEHRILAPLQPRAIIGIGLNYREHARESGKPLPEYPMVFMKYPSTVCHPGDPILLPTKLKSDQVDYEGELAVIIGKSGKNIPQDAAYDHIAGYACGHDVSARDWQFERCGGQFVRGKTFDTFCPLGPWVATPAEVPDPAQLQLTTRLNGEIVQDSPVSDLIFTIPHLIAFLSASVVLEAGTVILTGTPSGVGAARKPPRFLRDGDEVAISITGLGTLTNPVSTEQI